MINFNKFNSLISLVMYFDSEEKCKQAIIETRWGAGIEQDVVCPYCGHHHCRRNKDGRFHCTHCNSNFSCLVGTIFENTKIHLRKWFMAMYEISSHKKGISSHQLARDIEVTQKTAWFILHKVRTLFAQDDSKALEGEVEVDEMYLGGKEKFKHESKKTEGTQGRSTKTKTPIFGMTARQGQTKVIKVEDTKAKTLKPIIEQFIKEHSTIFTDESNSYDWLSAKNSKYGHGIVNHKELQFSDGNGTTTNTIEGFWSHFRRMVYGIYHQIGKDYVQRYIDEAVYRYNTRKQTESARFKDMFAKSVKLCNYATVVSLSANNNVQETYARKKSSVYKAIC